VLKIIKAAEPMAVDRINMCIYGPPGLGKSTLGFTAAAPLLLDCDGGAYRAHNRKDAVQVNKWADIEGITADDMAPYKTVIVDTAGRALDFLTADIIAKDPKKGYGGSLNLQGYGVLKSRFGAYLRLLRTFGKDVILIAHMSEERNGDDVIERLDVQGGSKGEIYKSVDAMGRIFVKGNDRFIDFTPRENSFGKNPCNLPIISFPLATTDVLATVIETIKERLNASVVESKEAERELQDWNLCINECSTLEEMNQILPQLKTASPAVKMVATARAKKLGFVFNQKSKVFEAVASAIS
jgi:hypothetical protein